MEDINSVGELYIRIKPALRTKIRELKRLGTDYIKEEDIWNYFKDSKWKYAINLNLNEMVNDILNVEEIELENFLKKELKNTKREINLSE